MLHFSQCYAAASVVQVSLEPVQHQQAPQCLHAYVSCSAACACVCARQPPSDRVLYFPSSFTSGPSNDCAVMLFL